MQPIRTTTDTKTQIPTAAISSSLFTSFEPSIILYCFIRISFRAENFNQIHLGQSNLNGMCKQHSINATNWLQWKLITVEVLRELRARTYTTNYTLQMLAKLPGEIRNTTKLDRTHWMIVVLSGRLLCTVPSTETIARSFVVVSRDDFRVVHVARSLSISVSLSLILLLLFIRGMLPWVMRTIVQSRPLFLFLCFH